MRTDLKMLFCQDCAAQPGKLSYLQPMEAACMCVSSPSLYWPQLIREETQSLQPVPQLPDYHCFVYPRKGRRETQRESKRDGERDTENTLFTSFALSSQES